MAGRFLREDSGPPSPPQAGNGDALPPELSFTCRETGAWQVGVSDEGEIRREETEVREVLPLTLRITVGEGTDWTRMVTIEEEVGDGVRELEGMMEAGVSIVAGRGAWLLDLHRNLLRRVQPIGGRSARFDRFECERANVQP